MKPQFKNKDSKHSHSHRRIEKKRLLAAIIVTVVVMFVEIIGGYFSKSISLVSDGAHMLTHAFALFISFFAIIIASRKPTIEKSFGFYRIEILAALLNGIVLIAITGFIAWEAYKRFLNPSSINVMEMIIIASIGLAANIVSAILLAGSKKNSINIRSAFIHMIGDTASSAAIIIGAVVMHFTGYYIIDAILSILICVAILYWAVLLLKDSILILMEAAPKNININNLEKDIIGLSSSILNIHDIHVWGITDDMNYMTAHIVIEDCMISSTAEIIGEIKEVCSKKYEIGHLVLQFETEECHGHDYDFN